MWFLIMINFSLFRVLSLLSTEKAGWYAYKKCEPATNLSIGRQICTSEGLYARVSVAG